MTTRKVTISQFAAALGISRQAAHRGVRRCGIPVEGGLVDLEVAKALWRSRTRRRVKSRPATQDTPTAPAESGAEDVAPYDESRARREAAEAGLAALALGEANGRLLARHRVELAVFHAARALRDQLTTCAGQLGAAVAPMTTAAECERTIRLEHVSTAN